MNIRDISLRLPRRRQRRVRRVTGEFVVQSPEGASGHAITDLFERLVAEAAKSGADDDCIAAALNTTQAAAEALAERLRTFAPRMLREHREFRRGFEDRLQRRWGPAADL